MAKGKLFKKGVSYVVERAIAKIQASADIWSSATAEGFRTNWMAWMSQLEPALRSTVLRLPPKTADVRANVINRVVPVALAIKYNSMAYQKAKISAVAPTTQLPAITRTT